MADQSATRVRSTPPARPELTSAPPPPADELPAGPPRAVRLAAALWWAGCLAAGVGIVAALLDLDAVRRRLTETAEAGDPTASADTVADGVGATIAVVLGGTGLLLLVSLVWVALVLRRRGWARWALVATALLLLLAVDVTQDMVAGGADVDRGAVLVAGGLVVVASAVLFAPSARAWFRRPPG